LPARPLPVPVRDHRQPDRAPSPRPHDHPQKPRPRRAGMGGYGRLHLVRRRDRVPRTSFRRTPMREAVIVSTARTGLAKSVRGGFNMTHGAVMGGHAVKHAIAKAGIDPGDVEDVYMGCAQPEGATGMNIARLSAIWAGCPVTTAGTTVNRFCSSGLQAIALAAHQIIAEGTPVAVGSGVESISLVQMGGMNTKNITEEHLMQVKPELWISMIETAEIVSERYGVARDRQDEYALESQRRTAAAQTAGQVP